MATFIAMLRHLVKRCNHLRPPSLSRCYTDRTEIAYEDNFDAPSLRLAVHFHVSGYDPVALEDWVKYVMTLAKQVGYQPDGRVSIPTTTEKISLIKPPHRYRKHLEEDIYLKTHRRIVRISEIPGSDFDIFMGKLQSKIPPGASLTVHDEKTEPLSDELLRLLKGGTRTAGVDRHTGLNPLLHRWMTAGTDDRLKNEID